MDSMVQERTGYATYTVNNIVADCCIIISIQLYP